MIQTWSSLKRMKIILSVKDLDVQGLFSCHVRGRSAEYQDLYIQACFETLTALTSWPCLHKIKNSHKSVMLSPSHFPSLLLPVCWN